MVTKGQMDPATFESRHRLELEHLVGLHDAFGGAVGKIPKLILATASVVLDIDEDPRPFADALRQQQVDEVLKGREALALASDQGAQSFFLVTLANNVQAIGLAGLDLDEDIEPKLRHELLEDLLRRRHGLRRYLGRFGMLGVRGAASGGNLGKLLGRQARLWATLSAVITRRPIGTSATAAVAVETAARTWTTITTGPRTTVATRTGPTVATGAWAAVRKGSTLGRRATVG